MTIDRWRAPPGGAWLLGVVLVLGASHPAGSTPPDPVRLRIGGYFENDTAVRLFSPVDVQKSQTRIEAGAELRWRDSLRLTALGRMIWDPPARLVGPDPDFGQKPIDRWQVGGLDSLEAELRELYLDWAGSWRGARLGLRLGKQQIVWGQSIGLRVLDVVNAFDLREFLLDDYADSRIPVFGARLEASLRGWSFELFALPDFESTRVPDPGSEFAFDPDLRGFLPGLAPPRGLVASSLSNGNSFLEMEDPDDPEDGTPEATAIGARVARSWRGFDLSLYYLDGPDPTPVLRRRIQDRNIDVLVRTGAGEIVATLLDQPVNLLTPEHVRVHMAGVSAARSWGPFVFWGEGTLAFGRAFAVEDLADGDGFVRRPDLQAVLAVDWTPHGDVFTNLQVFQRAILDHGAPISLDALATYLTLLIRLSLLDEQLVPQLFALYGFQESEAWIRPSIDWHFSDRLSFFAGMDLLLGAREGLFGQYAHRNAFALPSNVTLLDPELFVPDPPPGKPSRVWIGLRYSFDASF